MAEVAAAAAADPTWRRSRTRALVAGVRRAPPWTIAVGILGIGVYIVGVIIGFSTWNTNVFDALVIAPVLVLLTIPIARRIARAENNTAYVGIVLAAVVAKILASLVRYTVAFVVYKGNADAGVYIIFGKRFAPDFRNLDFGVELGRKFVGTGFVRGLTGVVFALFGAFPLGAFFIFAFMGFLGLLLFWRAFRIAVPEGNGHRYGLLVLFLPSLLYWPSSIGKEAWMMLTLGLASYGVAALLARRTSGVFALIAGLGTACLVRPHLALVVFAGLAIAVVIRRPARRSFLVPVFRIGAIAMVALLGALLANQAQTFLGVKNLTQESIQQELTSVGDRTEQGGSEFTPVQVNSPLDLPAAAVTVLFRPFAFEAHNAQALAAAAEGSLLLLAFAVSWRRLLNVPRLLRRTPYIAYALVYVLVFVFAFSSFSNFGILARQRTQALPLLLVFLALPAVAKPLRSRHQRRSFGMAHRG